MPFGTLILGAAAVGACVEQADGLRGRVDVSANVALVSDYRGRGLSVSDHDSAIQGGFDVAHESGFSAGVWASSIAPVDGASIELDLYAAQTFQIGPTELAIGATAYVFPGGDDLDYAEVQLNASRTLGPIDAVLGVNYAWRQDNLGDDDNIYVFLNGAAPVGSLGGIELTVNGGLGYEEGALAGAPSKTDWSVGLAAALPWFDLGATYVNTDLNDPVGDATVVLSVTREY